MKVKSYYADSIQSAMVSASEEMGPDAILITSRRTNNETRELGEYEVVFGLMSESEQARTQAPTEAQPQLPEAKAADPVSGMDAVRRELEAMRRTLATICRNGAGDHSSPELRHAEALLTEADFAPELIEQLLTALDLRIAEETLYNQAMVTPTPEQRRGRMRAVAERPNSRVPSLLGEQLKTMVEIAPGLGTDDNEQSVVALIGPPGSGKTTTIVKLAIQYGLTARRPTLIVSADGYRPGATEQLRIYAATLGVAFEAVESAAALEQVLEEHRNKGLVLIDTPGFAPAGKETARELARFLSADSRIDVHLLLPAPYRGENLARIIELFTIFGPKKAILTKLDETHSSGAALSYAILANLPISFVTTGQQIPEDIASASLDRLLNFLNVPDSGAEVSAA